MKLLRVLWIGIAFVTGCGDSVSPISALQTNQARWASVGPTSYAMTLSFVCGECLPVMGRAVVVTVTNGAVESRVFEDDGSAVDDDLGSSWRTVEGLFDVVADAIERDAHRLAVAYDPQFGFPQAISIDYREDLVDDEIGFIVTKFAVR